FFILPHPQNQSLFPKIKRCITPLLRIFYPETIKEKNQSGKIRIFNRLLISKILFSFSLSIPN
ncbi:MAG: hypothetical protein B7Z16_05395, partial [Algoriphagus sp. 32-45-6]